MTLDPNDPRLTAYALGELDDAEHAAIEDELTRDDTLRRAVAEIRAAADLLSTELRKEALMHLTDAQRTAIAQAAEPAKTSPFRLIAPPRSWMRTYRLPLALAASFALLIGGAWILMPSLEAARRSARHSTLAQARLRSPSSETMGTPPVPAEHAAGEIRATRVEKYAEIAERQVAQGSPQAGMTRNPLRNVASAVVHEERKDYGVASRPHGSEAATPNVDLQKARSSGTGEQYLVYDGIPRSAATPDKRVRSLAYLGEVDVAGRGARGRGGWIGDADGDLNFFGGGWWAPDYTPESYDRIFENPFLLVAQSPLSTFSIDVDTASYANVRRFLNGGSLPPPGAVRIEELINYFDYDYPQPTDEHPFSVNVEVGHCPWKRDHYLARVGLKGYEVPANERPAANLVFLIDVSGSMQSANRLPLVKEGLKLLVGQLSARDRVAMVVYAGASGLVLPSTYCSSRGAITAALDQLQAGGSTNGGAGIQLAYDTADASFIEGGVNRVILATDGDFNVGITSQDQLTQLIQDEAKTGVCLSVLGFGMGNLKDSTLEKLADKGNGNYAYIDTLDEAKKVLVDQIGGTLVTIAKDVKIQIEFNPLAVSAYRLIGYENRVLAAQDFNDDKKDAGEIGAGHTVTALYELVPAGAEMDVPSVDPLKYQTPTEVAEAVNDNEMMTVKLRYKEPEEDESKLIEVPVPNYTKALRWARPNPSANFQFSSAVAAFGMLLRGSEYAGDATYDTVLALAGQGLGQDRSGYRAEFIQLVQRARAIQQADR